NHINDPCCRPAKFGSGSGRNNLKLFHSVQRDIDRGALAAKLFAEETIVVIAAVKADVVENPALTGEVNLVAVRTLDDAYARRQRQQVFKLTAQNRSVVHRSFIESGTRFSLDGVHSRCPGDGYPLFNP